MEFMTFTSKQNKHYTTDAEFQRRLGNWKENHKIVQRLNEMDLGATFADNFTSDMDDEEYSKMLGRHRKKVLDGDYNPLMILCQLGMALTSMMGLKADI